MPLDIARIAWLRPQNQLHYFPSLGSTMTEASRLASAGAPHGAAVIADEQTAGIGRLGRSWISQSEAGIYCSILLRLGLPHASIPIASLLLGLAVAEAIEKATQLSCDLRWPNDVLINEKKASGILTQLVDSCIVAGIGVNVNQTSFEERLRTPATSLRLESQGRVQSREEILVKLFESIDTFCALLAAEGPSAVLRAFTANSSYAVDRRVIVEESGLRGITSGLDEQGFLLLRTGSGTLQRLATGGIRPDPTA